MRNFFALLILSIFLVSACSPQSPISPTSPPTSTSAPTETVPPTATEIPATPTPSPTPTPLPVSFDLNGYKDFAIIKNQLQGFQEFKGGKSVSLLSTYMSPDGSKLALSGCFGSLASNFDCATLKSGFLVVMDIPSGKVVNEIPMGDHWPGQVMISSDNKTMMFSTNEQKIILWDLATNKEIRTFIAQDRTGRNKYPDVAISPDNKYYAGAMNGFLYVWDANGKQLAKMPVYQAHISSGLKFSADSSMLGSFDEDRQSILIYNTSDWSVKEKLSINAAWGIEFSPDGRFVGAIDADTDTVKIWQVSDGKEMAELHPTLYQVSLYFGPKNDLVLLFGSANLTKDPDNTLKGEIYDTQNWTKIDDFETFEDEGKVQFTTDGSQMTIVSDYSFQLWSKSDDMLKAGYEKWKKFQQALADGDYTLAASLFTVDDNQKGYLTDMGIDLNNMPDSFAKLCQAKTILCYPIKDIRMMGYTWDNILQYVVHLETPDGNTYKTTNGMQSIYLYARPGADGEPVLMLPPVDR